MIACLCSFNDTRVMPLLPCPLRVPTKGGAVFRARLVLFVHIRHKHFASSAGDAFVKIWPLVLMTCYCPRCCCCCCRFFKNYSELLFMQVFAASNLMPRFDRRNIVAIFAIVACEPNNSQLLLLHSYHVKGDLIQHMLILNLITI